MSKKRKPRFWIKANGQLTFIKPRKLKPKKGKREQMLANAGRAVKGALQKYNELKKDPRYAELLARHRESFVFLGKFFRKTRQERTIDEAKKALELIRAFEKELKKEIQRQKQLELPFSE